MEPKTKKSRRIPLLLNGVYKAEAEAHKLIKNAPSGEGRALLKSLILIGFKDKYPQSTSSGDQ